MQKRKNKIKNVAVVLLNILFIYSLYLILAKNNDLSYELYWTVEPFLMVAVISLISRWSDIGLNADIEKSKAIQLEFDNIASISTIFYGLLFFGVSLLDIIKEDARNNIYIIVGFFIMTLFYEMAIFLAIYSARKRTAKLLEETYNKKKK